MYTKYPFELVDTLISNLTVRRTPEVEEGIELPVAAEVRVSEPGFPILQINLKLKAPDDSKVYFDIEVIGIFKYVGEKDEYDKELNKNFAFEKALHVIWSFARQMIKIVTSQMGMDGINLNTPVSFLDFVTPKENT